MSILFAPLSIRNLTVKNRLWVSPMCQYSAVDGMPGDWHRGHLTQFARGGAGLVIAEASAVSPEGRISPADAGIWNDAQRDAWASIVDDLHAAGTAAGIQLAHAGRKASTRSPLHGAKGHDAKGHDARGSVPLDEGGWTTVAPSAIAYEGFDTPVALDEAGIEQVIADMRDAAVRARAAGFDVLEVHAAHGYLLHEFLSPLSNLRTDAWGGTLEGRARLLLKVVDEVVAVADGAAVFVRFSAEDWAPGGLTVADTVRVTEWVTAHGVDLVDISSGGLVAHQSITTGPGYQVPLAAEIKRATGALVSAVGMIDDGPQAEAVLAAGDADAVMAGRAWLRDPHLGLRAADALGDDVPWPVQYERARGYRSTTSD